MAGILPEWFPGVLFLPCPVSFGVVDPEASREGVGQEEDKGVQSSSKVPRLCHRRKRMWKAGLSLGEMGHQEPPTNE